MDSTDDGRCTKELIKFHNIKDVKRLFKETTDNTVKKRPHCKVGMCKIESPSGSVICVPRRRKIPHSMLGPTEEAIKNLLQAGIIRRSSST